MQQFFLVTRWPLTMKNENSLWNFFASVRLALFLLCLLACTSVIGTVIPQNQTPQWYVGEYGDMAAHLLNVLDILDMYSSWWFLGLLGLLCANLIICSFDRFPGVWKQITADGLDISTERLARMKRKKEWQTTEALESVVQKLSVALQESGWKSGSRNSEMGTMLFAQKGAYSRTGVFLVHLSVLVIFVGAIIGELYGFKGSVMIPETRQIDKISSFNGGKAIELGFTVRCDAFAIEFYPTGMIKDYRSELTVLENGKELFRTPIEVNSPLVYRGITFYQSSYEGFNNFLVKVSRKDDGKGGTFVLPFQEEGKWAEEGLRFGVINAELAGESVLRMKIWFSDDHGAPSQFWMRNGESVTVERENGTYLLTAKQMYATGLQVCKDPGVWVVYSGCALMLLGLMTAFFLSHRRIWLCCQKRADGTAILLAGSVNKNRMGFDKVFNELAETLSTR